MAKSSKTLHNIFLKKLAKLDATRQNFELAFNDAIISEEDILQAYAGLYLDVFTDFENLIENIFLGILESKIKHNNSNVKKRIKILPKTEFLNVMLAGKAYLEWLPYASVTTRANQFLLNGLPFTGLSDLQKDRLSGYHKIRNALAHKSSKAISDFNSLIANYRLLPKEKTPQGFLRNIPNTSTNKTQLEIISDQLKAISYSLCH